jgi:hypothetical protein
MFGASIKNNSNEVLIDSDTHNYHFVGKFTKSAHWMGPYIIQERGSSTHYWNSPNGLAASQVRGYIFQYKYYTTDQSKPPLCFVKPSSTGSSSPYFSIVNTFYNPSGGGYWEFWILQSGPGQLAPTIYLFVTADAMPTALSYTYTSPGDEPADSSGPYAFQTLDAEGNVSFDSRYKPLRVIGAGEYQTPTQAVSGSKGSGTTPYLAPNAPSQINTGNTTTLSDIIVHCPAFSTGCCEYETKREHIHRHYNWLNINTSSYYWGRFDFWWSFYRSAIQLDTVSTMQVGYITYMSGHIWEHAYNSSGINWGSFLGGLLLGGLTGGLGFGLLLGAVAVSVSIDNSTLTGAYLPYENSTRNANEPASYILSKASYYD